jgi:hypothetical protein
MRKERDGDSQDCVSNTRERCAAPPEASGGE